MIRIGTRGSMLAMKQAREVADKLSQIHPQIADRLIIEEIATSGDRIQDRPLSEVGGKGLFTKELEQALLDNRIDLAVHSMKDVETQVPDGTLIAAILEREDVRDVFISPTFQNIADMPAGAKLGSSSLRRRSQAKFANPDIALVDFRGNVQTRLDKLARGVAQATFLAAAGLKRLGQAADMFHVVETDDMLPAVAQGAIGLHVRANDNVLREIIEPLNHGPTARCVNAERAYLAKLDGSCRTPIAGHGKIVGDQFIFKGEVLSIDGARRIQCERTGKIHEAINLAQNAASEILDQAGPQFFERGL